MRSRSLVILALGLLLAPLATLTSADEPADDVADVKSQDLRAGGDEHKRYFLIGAPEGNAKAPAEGYGLVLVMPGGDGSADFQPFVKRIHKNVLAAEKYITAELVSKKWTADQQIIWPTAKSKVAEMKFTTEELVETVAEDVARRHKLNPRRIFTLSWSSGGPAAYAVSLRPKRIVAGSFIAMSVFYPEGLVLSKAKGHRYYLYHSPDDKVCAFNMAEKARDELRKQGAATELRTYDGGHGWFGDTFGELKTGFRWLEGKPAVPGGK